MIETSSTGQFALADPLPAELARQPDGERKVELLAQCHGVLPGGSRSNDVSTGKRIHLGCRDIARPLRHLDDPSPPIRTRQQRAADDHRS